MSNLPPGCRISDIPGNRPEDGEWDKFYDWLSYTLDTEGLEPRDAYAIVRMGLAALRASRRYILEENLLSLLESTYDGVGVEISRMKQMIENMKGDV